MKLRDFPILANENIHHGVINLLHSDGWDVSSIAGSTLVGADDDTILNIATSQNRVVLTHDSDFGRLAIAALTPLLGIVFLRPGHLDPHFTMGSIETIIAADLDLVPPFIVVAKRTGDRVSIRQRSL